MPAPKRHLELLTTSAAKTFRSCQRLYQHQYVELYRPAYVPDALAFGDRTHLGLEAWWKAAQREPWVACPWADREGHGEWCEACAGSGNSAHALWLGAAFDTINQEPDPFRRAAIRALMLGYHIRWRDMRYDGHPIEVLAVEQEFTGPLINPRTDSPSKTWLRGGKIDVLVRVDGRVKVIEHKSSSEDFSPGSDYRRRLRLDTQISNYLVGARSLGYPDVDGVIYDVLGKHDMRQKKATPAAVRKYTKPTRNNPTPRIYANQREFDETVEEYELRVTQAIAEAPDDYYARFEVVRLQREEDAAAQDAWQIGEQIRDAKRLNRWPRNPGHCGAYGRTCSFLGVCEGTESLTDQTRFRKAERAHEELSERRYTDGLQSEGSAQDRGVGETSEVARIQDAEEPFAVL